MPVEWYTLHSKSMKEAFLSEQLSLRKVEVYYPCVRVQPVNPRSRKVRPYFPGYLFVHLNLEEANLSMLQWIPGSLGIVAFGGMPSHVPDNLITAIQRRVDEINAFGGEFFDELKSGDIVTIREGPFRGYEAIFDVRLSGDERVRVLLKLLGRQQIPLELPVRQIKCEKQ